MSDPVKLEKIWASSYAEKSEVTFSLNNYRVFTVEVPVEAMTIEERVKFFDSLRIAAAILNNATDRARNNVQIEAMEKDGFIKTQS